MWTESSEIAGVQLLQPAQLHIKHPVQCRCRPLSSHANFSVQVLCAYQDCSWIQKRSDKALLSAPQQQQPSHPLSDPLTSSAHAQRCLRLTSRKISPGKQPLMLTTF